MTVIDKLPLRRKKVAKARLPVRQLIRIDKQQMVAEVEGSMSFGALVKDTLALNCLPAVVPELMVMTVGDVLSGIAVASSSFRYGAVHETVLEFDLRLNDGELVTCRPDNEHSELFFAFPGSYGTLGSVTRAVLKLIPVKDYIELNHLHFWEPKTFFARLAELCQENHVTGSIAYIDAVVFAPNEMYITTGRFTEQAPYQRNYLYLTLFYRSIQSRYTDFLSMKHYVWRWDSDWFWRSDSFGLQNPLLRLLLGRWCLNSKTYMKITRCAEHSRLLNWLGKRVRSKRETLIKNVVIPVENAATFLNFVLQEIGVKPIWVCPMMRYDAAVQYPLFELEPGQLYINFGVWGSLSSEKAPGYYGALLEEKVQTLGGRLRYS